MKKFFLMMSVPFLMLVSCDKEDETPSSSQQPKVHQREVPVEDDNGNVNAKIIFESYSKEALDKLDLEHFSFREVEPEALPDDQTDHGASPEAEMNDSAPQKQGEELPEDAVWVTMESDKETIAVETKYIGGGNEKTATQWPENTYVALHGGNNWRRVQITNMHSNPLNTSFRWSPGCSGSVCQTIAGYGRFTRYSGYSYKLYNGQWAYYYNCNYAVAAHITLDKRYGWHYRWQWWSNCRP